MGRLLIAANAPPATTAPPLSVQRAVDLLTLAERTHTIASPSKGRGVCSDHLALFEFDAEPHVAALRELVHRGSLAAVASCAGATDVAGNNCGQLLKEGSLYPLTTSYVPSWVTATRRTPQRGGSSPAFRVFGLERIDRVASPGFVLPWNCQPELFTEALPFHPAFNGEVKSAMSSGDSAESPGMFDQIFTYVMLGMVASLFRDVPDGHRRYFKHPPIGYGLAAFPHVGYIVAVEWIGLLFVSVVSQPFFLGSPEHKAAVAALPDHDYGPDKVDMDVRGVKVFTYPPQAADARVGEDISRAADRPYVDPLLQALREDIRQLLGPLEGRKVPLTQVHAAWKKRIGPDAVFDLMKYQKCISRRKNLGLRQLLMRIPDTVNIVTAACPNGKTAVEWAVLIDVAAAWPHKRTDDGSRP